MCISIQRIIQGLVPVVIMSALCACSNAERTTRRADAAMAIGEYQEAASLYRRAYMQTAPRERASRGALAYKMGEAYRSFGNVGRALAAYKNAERFGDADSLLLRKQGDMLRYAGNYKGTETYGKRKNGIFAACFYFCKKAVNNILKKYICSVCFIFVTNPS